MLNTNSVHAKEDVLHKKSHHLGFWRQRFFRFDGKTLRYWKHKRLALQLRPPRGEIPLAGCHVVAGHGSRFVIRVPSGAYDEELEAKDCKDRDEWIYSLNTAVLSERLSLSKQVCVEDFLRAKDLWEPLEEAAATYVASAVMGVDEVISIGDLALRHVRFGAARVRRAGQPDVKPRQGRLVHAGRRIRERLGSEHHKEASSPDATDTLDTLESTEFWLLLMSSRLLSEVPEEVSLGAGSLLKERSMPLSFEVLHAFVDPLDSSGPVVSLPLASCEVGEVACCKDGSGWSLKLYEADEPGCSVPHGAALWSIILESREECELWRKAAQAARWAARALAHGRERAAEEALAAFNSSPKEWGKATAKRLQDVALYAPSLPTLSRAFNLPAWASPNQRLKKRISLGGDVTPGTTGGGSLVSSCSSSSMPGTVVGGPSSSIAAPPLGATEAACEAVRKVLAACEDVCTEAEGLLEASLAQRPLRKDAAGAALRCALVPALSAAGRCWSKWSGDLPQGEARALLRWLEARRQAARSLGLVCPPPLETALPGLASELSLRMGTYLRKLTEELLVAELGERVRQASCCPSRESRRGSFESIGSMATGMPGRLEAEVFAVSTLPVDFFTFLNSCLLMDRDQGVPELRLCTLRITQFMVKEVQECLWGWLQATLPAVPRDWRPRPGAAQDALPTLMRRWFWGVASLANAMPAFQQNLSELDADSSSSDESDEEVAEDQDAKESIRACRRGRTKIGPQLFSKEWRFDKQEKDFEALLEAFLWAACDVASGRWRKHVLNETFPVQEGGAAIAVPLVGPLLSIHLDPCLSPLRGWLDPSLFERLLRKLFVVVICSLVVKLSRGSWLQALTREKKEERLSEEASFLCLYFAGLSAEPRDVSDGSLLWDSERVASVFHAVLLSLHPLERTRSSPKQPRQSPKKREPLPHDRRVPLGFEDGLSKLVPVLTDGPLPLSEVLKWFCKCGVPCQHGFQELPRPVPSGGLYLHPAEAAQDRRRSSKTWEDMKFSGSTSVSSWEDSFSSAAGSDNPRRHRPSVGLSLFGEASCEQRPISCITSEEDACSRNSNALGLASEGACCELRIEQVGAYGAFCDVVRQKEHGAQPSKPRRRWLHLTKAGLQETPLFQLLHAQPTSAQAAPDATPEEKTNNVSLPLTLLKEASFKSAASLDLVFSRASGGDGPEVLVQYSLSFDCPSHLFRVRLVLERWWDQQQLQELRPVVTYTPSGRTERAGAASHEQLPEENSWRGLAGSLKREVLEARLGGLWSDVRKRLEAAMAT